MRCSGRPPGPEGRGLHAAGWGSRSPRRGRRPGDLALRAVVGLTLWWAPAQAQPPDPIRGPLTLRGQIEPCNRWLPSADADPWGSLDDPSDASHQHAASRPADSTSRLGRAWAARLDHLHRLKINTVVLAHPWPPGFRDDGKIGQTPCPPIRGLELLARRARSQGMRLMLGWGGDDTIACSNAGGPQRPPGSPASPRPAEFQSRVARLLQASPSLGGLVVFGDASLGSDRAVALAAIAWGWAEGARESGLPLIVSSRGLTPAFTAELGRICPSVMVLHETALGADVAEGGKGTEELPTVYAGRRPPAMRYLFWGDGKWVYDWVQHVRHCGAQGGLWPSTGQDLDLAAEAFARYAFSMGSGGYSAAPWVHWLDRHYGLADSAAATLQALEEASHVSRALTAWSALRDPRLMPQAGLLLGHFLGTPINDEATAGRSQVDHEAGAWLGEVRRHAMRCNTRLESLQHVPVPDEYTEGFQRLRNRVAVNGLLGEFVCLKARAAEAFGRFGAGEGTVAECLVPLQRSVELWPEWVRVLDAVHPGPITYWQACPVSPPPWSAGQLARSLRRVRGKLRQHQVTLQREYDLLRLGMSRQGRTAVLPLWDRVTAQPTNNIEPTDVVDFEWKADPRLVLGDTARVTADKTRVLRKGRSLVVDTRGWGTGAHVAFTTVPGQAPILGHRPYQVSMAYRVIDRGGAFAEPFELRMEPVAGEGAIGHHRRWGAPAEYTSVRILQVPDLPDDTHVLKFIIHGEAAIVVDNIEIARVILFDAPPVNR